MFRTAVIGREIVGVGPVPADASLRTHPDAPFAVAANHLYEIVAQRAGLCFVVEIAVHLIPIVTNQSVAGTYPNIAIMVLCQRLHLLMGQSVLTGKMAEAIVSRCL
jgi:hypothetical protein